MPLFTLVRDHPFAGAATLANDGDGVALGSRWDFAHYAKAFGWEQALTLHLDGSGNVVSDQAETAPRYALTNSADEKFAGTCKIVVQTVYPAAGDAQYHFILGAKEATPSLGGGYLDCMHIRWKDTTTGPQMVTGGTGHGFFAIGRAANANEVLTHTIERVYNGADSWTVTLTTTGSDGGATIASGEVTFTAAGYADAPLPVGFGIDDGNDGAFPFGNWKITNFQSYAETPDTDPPTVSGFTTNRIGTRIIGTFVDASALTTDPITGMTFTQNGVNIPVGSGTRTGIHTIEWEVTSGFVYEGRTVLGSYDADTGNLTDAALNELAEQSGIAVTNLSVMGEEEYDFPEEILTTNYRGGVAFPDGPEGAKGKELVTGRRLEWPRGCKAGTGYIDYAGSTSESADFEIQLLRSKMILLDPEGEITGVVTLTDGYASRKFLGYNDMERLGFSEAILPGGACVVISTYKTTNPAVEAPQLVGKLYTVSNPDAVHPELAADHVEVYTIVDAGAINATDRSLTRDWDYETSTAMHADAPSYRLGLGWGPMGGSGQAHPNYSPDADRSIPAYSGNSINVAQNDFSSAMEDGVSFDPWGARGWNGRECRDEIPYVIQGVAGGSSAVAGGNTVNDFIFGLSGQTRKVTHLVNTWGHNDIRQIGGGRPALVSDMTPWMHANVIDPWDTFCLANDLKQILGTLTPIEGFWIDWADTAGFDAEWREYNLSILNDWAGWDSVVGRLDHAAVCVDDPVAYVNDWPADWVTDAWVDLIHGNAFVHQIMADGSTTRAIMLANPNNTGAAVLIRNNRRRRLLVPFLI